MPTGLLQDALDNADSGDKIWVSAGIYMPTTEVGGSGSRYQSFQMKNFVAICGGFAGTETQFGQRNVQNNITVLSGDIGVPDDPNDNCFHIFYHPDDLGLDPNAILDGFTITAGNADGSGDQNGGGMYNGNNNPTVTDCIFSGNSALNYGGGIYSTVSLTITDCILSNNSANGEVANGGGIFALSAGEPNSIEITLINSTIRGNSANSSDGFYSSQGGGIYSEVMFDSASLEITLINSIISGNSACSGGGMYNTIALVDFGSTEISLNNSTVCGNSATDGSGGGIYNYEGIVTVSNSILWGNTASLDGNQIYNDADSFVISYSDIDGSGGSGEGWDGTLGTDGGGNIDVDPWFVDPNGIDGVSGTIDDNLRLMPGSPCVDAGDNTAVPAGITTDINGFPRFIYDSCTPDTGNGTPPIVDMGAYELFRSDINSNGKVNLEDFSQFVSYWMDIACGTCGGADLTCDGDVNGDDLTAFVSNWLAGATP